MDKKMQDRIHQMAVRTWETIAGDILSMFQEDGLSPIIDKETVIDTVCDASYMMYHGNDIEAYKVWNALDGWENKMDAIRDAFPHEKYGW